MRKFGFCIFGAIPAPQRPDNSNKLPPKFESALHQSIINELAKIGIACYEDVPARPESMNRRLGPLHEKLPNLSAFPLVQCRESGEWLTSRAVEGWWNAPNSAVPIG